MNHQPADRYCRPLELVGIPGALLARRAVAHRAFVQGQGKIRRGNDRIGGAAQGVVLMQMIEGIYRSAESGKSVEIRG